MKPSSPGAAKTVMKRRVHIVGAPRSGTTLMAELMIAGFRFDGHAPHEMSIFMRPDRPVGLFCSKNPQDILHVRPLLAIDGNLWVIYVLRDPRDVIVSRHGKAPDKYWSNLFVWRWYHQAAGRILQHPRCILVRYEDLVREPDAVQAELMRRMPFLDRQCAFSEYHRIANPSAGSLKAMRGVRPVSADNIGAWRRHRPRLAAQLAMHGDISAELIALGYEQDDGWLSELKGIRPDNQLSHLQEKLSVKKRIRMQVRRTVGFLRYLSGLRERVPVCMRSD